MGLVIKTRGKKDVQARVTDEGVFWAEIEGVRLTADTFGELKEKVQTNLKKEKLKIGYSRKILSSPAGPVGFVDGIVYGVHEGNGNYLVVERDIKTQIQKYRGDGMFRKLTKEEKDEYIRMKDNWQEMRRKISKWEEERKLKVPE